jgi:hypothetical protein
MRDWQAGGLGALAWLAVAGCGGAKIALPVEFDDGMDQLVTDGRNGDARDGTKDAIEIGPYTIDGVKRGLSGSKGFEAFDGFEAIDKSGYSFSLAGGGKQKLSGKCAMPAAKPPKEGEAATPTDERPALACVCELGGKTVARVLVEDLAGEYGGPLVVGDVDARAVGVYKLRSGDKLVGRPAGYEVDDATGAVAAVEVLPGSSHVWIKKRLLEPGRRGLMCTLAGLMLWIRPDQGE